MAAYSMIGQSDLEPMIMVTKFFSFIGVTSINVECGYYTPSPFPSPPQPTWGRGDFRLLMPKTTLAGKYHCQSIFITCGNDFLITHRATRLNNGMNASWRNFINAIAKWKKCI